MLYLFLQSLFKKICHISVTSSIIPILGLPSGLLTAGFPSEGGTQRFRFLYNVMCRLILLVNTQSSWPLVMFWNSNSCSQPLLHKNRRPPVLLPDSVLYHLKASSESLLGKQNKRTLIFWPYQKFWMPMLGNCKKSVVNKEAYVRGLEVGLANHDQVIRRKTHTHTLL